MKIEYLRTAKKSYMMIKEMEQPYEDYEVEMMLRNDIPSLLPFKRMETDGKVEYWYDVTGMQSLDKMFAVARVTEKHLTTLLQNLMTLKYHMDEYLLDEKHIYYATSMIFHDRFSGKLRFCYVPGYEKAGGMALRGLFEEVIQFLDHSDMVAVNMGYEMYERANQAEFVVEDCKACLALGDEARKNYGQPRPISGQTVLPQPPPPEEDELEYLPAANSRKRGHRRKRRYFGRRESVEYSHILEEEQTPYMAAESFQNRDQTQYFPVRDSQEQQKWTLVYRGNGLETDLVMSEFPYFVGKDEKVVQGVVEAPTVSRVHAKFFIKEKNLYMEDNNSTNGTYLNRRLVPMNTPVEVEAGDRIVFGTEEYILR